MVVVAAAVVVVGAAAVAAVAEPGLRAGATGHTLAPLEAGRQLEEAWVMQLRLVVQPLGDWLL